MKIKSLLVSGILGAMLITGCSNKGEVVTSYVSTPEKTVTEALNPSGTNSSEVNKERDSAKVSGNVASSTEEGTKLADTEKTRLISALYNNILDLKSGEVEFSFLDLNYTNDLKKGKISADLNEQKVYLKFESLKDGNFEAFMDKDTTGDRENEGEWNIIKNRRLQTTSLRTLVTSFGFNADEFLPLAVLFEVEKLPDGNLRFFTPENMTIIDVLKKTPYLEMETARRILKNSLVYSLLKNTPEVEIILTENAEPVSISFSYFENYRGETSGISGWANFSNFNKPLDVKIPDFSKDIKGSNTSKPAYSSNTLR